MFQVKRSVGENAHAPRPKWTEDDVKELEGLFSLNLKIIDVQDKKKIEIIKKVERIFTKGK